MNDEDKGCGWSVGKASKGRVVPVIRPFTL